MIERTIKCCMYLLGPQHFDSVAATHYKSASADTLRDHIHLASQQEAEVSKGLRSIDKKAPKALADGTALWEKEDSYVYHKGRLYVPNMKELRRDVVKTCHNSLTMGHPGAYEGLTCRLDR